MLADMFTTIRFIVGDVAVKVIEVDGLLRVGKAVRGAATDALILVAVFDSPSEVVMVIKAWQLLSI